MRWKCQLSTTPYHFSSAFSEACDGPGGRILVAWAIGRKSWGHESPEFGVGGTLMQIIPQIFKKNPLRIHKNAISSEKSFFFWGVA